MVTTEVSMRRVSPSPTSALLPAVRTEVRPPVTATAPLSLLRRGCKLLVDIAGSPASPVVVVPTSSVGAVASGSGRSAADCLPFAFQYSLINYSAKSLASLLPSVDLPVAENFLTSFAGFGPRTPMTLPCDLRMVTNELYSGTIIQRRTGIAFRFCTRRFGE